MSHISDPSETGIPHAQFHPASSSQVERSVEPSARQTLDRLGLSHRCLADTPQLLFDSLTIPTTLPRSSWLRLHPTTWLWYPLFPQSMPDAPGISAVLHHSPQRPHHETTTERFPYLTAETLADQGFQAVTQATPETASTLFSQLADVRWAAPMATLVASSQTAEGAQLPRESITPDHALNSTVPIETLALFVDGADLALAQSVPVTLAFPAISEPVSSLDEQRRSDVLPTSPELETEPEGTEVPIQLTLLVPEARESLPVTQVLPPPTLGELGLVTHEDGWIRLSLTDLDEEGRMIQAQLNATLRWLANPSRWEPYTDLFALYSAPDESERKRSELRSAVLTSHGRAHTQVASELADLEQTAESLAHLRQAQQRVQHERTHWQDHLRQAKSLAQQLAQQYWACWQRDQARFLSDMSNQTSPIHPNLPALRALPPLTQIFGATTTRVAIPADLPVAAVLAAYSNAQSDGGARWGETNQPPNFLYTKPNGVTSVQIRPDNPEIALDEAIITSLWRQVRALNDLDGDVFLVALAQAMAAPGDEEGHVWITGGQILDYRGVQPIMRRDSEGGPLRRAGHRRHDLERVAECVGRMRNTWVVVDQRVEEIVLSGKRKRKRQRRYTRESPLILIAEVIRQHELTHPQQIGEASSSPDAPTGNEEIGAPITRSTEPLGSALETTQLTAQPPSLTIAWRYRMGAWLKPAHDTTNRQVAWVVQGALRYDPIRQYWEKRLARYFILHLRIQGSGGGATMTMKVGELLAELSLPVDERHPERTRQHFEQALNTLQADGQIDGWAYAPDNVPLPARKWLATWAGWSLQVMVAPQHALPPTPDEEQTQVYLRDRATTLRTLQDDALIEE